MDVIRDLETNRIKAVIVPVEQDRRKFTKIYHNALKSVDESKLHGQSAKLLITLMKHVTYGNVIPSTHKMAILLNMRQTNVARAYKELKDERFIIEKDRVYYMNPYIFWMGNEKQQEILCHQLLSDG